MNSNLKDFFYKNLFHAKERVQGGKKFGMCKKNSNLCIYRFVILLILF